jgi:hypothetical protein
MNTIIASKIHKPAEYLGLVATLAALLMIYLQVNGAPEVLMIGMSLLAGAYFLRAFIPINAHGDGKIGVLELLGRVIVPRVSMIACAAAVDGILFETLHLQGGGEMILIGCSVLAIGIVSAVVCLFSNREKYGFFLGYLLRMVPVFVLGIYLFPGKAA